MVWSGVETSLKFIIFFLPCEGFQRQPATVGVFFALRNLSDIGIDLAQGTAAGALLCWQLD
jgi:hypothetical protein